MTSAVEPLGVGVIGCGQWGPNYVRILDASRGCRVHGVADRDPERLAAIGERYAGITLTSEPQALLDASEVDAVIVATPTTTHHRFVRAALQAGKHVLCEKPLTATSEQAAELVELADRVGRVLMVGHVFLYNPGVLYLKQMLADGRLGTPHYFDSIRTNLGPFRRDVGAIHDLASHDVSIFNFLLDAQPEQVTAQVAAYSQEQNEDVAFLTLTYPGGVLCHVHVSCLNPRKVRELTVVGSERMAVWDDTQPTEAIRIYDRGLAEHVHYNTFGEFQRILRDGDITIPKVRLFEPLARQVEHFLACVRSGERPATDGRNGLQVVRVLEAALASARDGGRPVPVAGTA